MPPKEFYLEQIANELAMAREALALGNDGKARVCARRAAGCAISWYAAGHPDQTFARDALQQLLHLKTHPDFPAPVHEAALRLTTKISEKFRYPFSEDPLQDAQIIIDHITSVMDSDTP